MRPSLRLKLAVLFAATLSLGACGDGSGGAADTGSDAAADALDGAPGPACEPGTRDCACLGGAACEGGLVCDPGARLCRPPPAACQPGQTGCTCAPGDACARSGDACVLGTCQPAGCRAGALGCQCAGGGCDEGLTCEGGSICATNTGNLGGFCFADGTCNDGFRCQGGFCVICSRGTAGCACDAGLCHGALACVEGHCADANDPDVVPPSDPVCRTPCSAGFTDEAGGYHACPATGYLEGCLAGLECVSGSCVLPGEDPPSCQGDNDCPSHQRCILGTCYSNCEGLPDECPVGQSCHTFVCRQECATDAPTCPPRMACESDNGELGHCVPLADKKAGGETATEVAGNLDVDKGVIDFSVSHTSDAITIRNQTPEPVTVTVRKLRHRVLAADGASEAADLDVDRDGVADAVDRCKYVPDPDQLDTDGDALGNACDPDDDGDGVADADDDCPRVADPGQGDVDGDGVGDACVDDRDGDGVRDADDNCPDAVNPGQENAAGQGLGDACRPVRSAFACDPLVDCPLYWLELGVRGGAGPAETARVQELTLEVAANGEVVVALAHADAGPGAGWSGTIEVSAPRLNAARVDLWYAAEPDGQWSGQLHYFADFGTGELAAWRQAPNPAAGAAPAAWSGTRDDQRLFERVGNAFIQKWAAFRIGRITWDQFRAVMTATETESWKDPSVSAACPDRAGACYPYSAGTSGLRSYTSSLASFPIPTGGSELPIAMNLYAPTADPARLQGRIESAMALQYAGNPAVSLRFANDPATCSRETGGACVTWLEDLSADIVVGGRTASTPTDPLCGAHGGEGFVQARVPWLVPGFARDTYTDPSTGLAYRYACRDARFPYDSAGASTPAERARLADLDANLALSNPVPDARPMRRTLRAIDGALINQSELFVIFEERFDSFLSDDDDAGFSAYGYMVLRREPTALDRADQDGDDVPDVFEGATPADPGEPTSSALGVSCSPDLVREVLGVATPLETASDETIVKLAMRLVTGHDLGATRAVDPAEEQVHYLCADTGMFDDGPPSQFEPCPIESEVVFFTLDPARISAADVAAHPCNAARTCRATLNSWRADASSPLVQLDVPWRCTDPESFYCTDVPPATDADPSPTPPDRRLGKTFFAKAAPGSPLALTSLPETVDEAFRYKTRFQNRQGTSIGFAPQICIPDSDEIPYCYDPAAIEGARERVDCVLALWADHYDQLGDRACPPDGGPGCVDPRALVTDFLRDNFATSEEHRSDLPLPVVRDGFERSYAELMVMQGDEALTHAFASRFDLADNSTASFEGTLFEGASGIDLSGVAGAEMRELYLATQYYQEALDRFYASSPLVWSALKDGVGAPRNFVTADTVIAYFDRLIRASTQKSRAASEIARRYQNLNQAALARRVIERAYAATYLESVVMSRMMLRVVEVSLPEDRAQIKKAVSDAALRYRMSLLDMYQLYTSLTDQVNFFGLAPDVVPFPTVDAQEAARNNAFEQILFRAQNKIARAKEREVLAIESNRSFDTDAEQFQSTLVGIRNTYEDQLAELCGTFVVGGEAGGVVRPAISRYAGESELTAAVGDPCGLVGNGDIHQALGQFELLKLDIERLSVQLDNVFASVDIELERVAAQCGIIESRIDFTIATAGKKSSLRQSIAEANMLKENLQWAESTAATLLGVTQCVSPTSCVVAGISYGAYALGSAAAQVFITTESASIAQSEQRIAALETGEAKFELEAACQAAEVDSLARTKELMLQVEELNLELQRADYQTRLQLSEVQRLRNKAKRLELLEREAEGLAINVEVARNDPNVRIYKNDAIINADVAFEDALRELYKATVVFEYYTSQSFAQKEQLFLIRLAARGDYNLENYAADLENAFYDFEDEFGLPETRVAVLSLRDDILDIPRLDAAGRALPNDQRIELMRKALRDPARLDRDGYLAIPFKTDTQELSPLTRNHKLLFIEAEVNTSASTDIVGRLYLRQAGTSVVRTVRDDTRFYQFGTLTAVVNPFFNGVRYFTPEVYRSVRMRDRPFANTHWELVINQRDEHVNQDLDLQALSDIRLFLYYSDFTAF